MMTAQPSPNRQWATAEPISPMPRTRTVRPGSSTLASYREPRSHRKVGVEPGASIAGGLPAPQEAGALHSGPAVLVDSNSTRTESYVAIRPDRKDRTQVDATKAPDHNGCQRITRPSRGMRAGLKILVSAVQSRPSPPVFNYLAGRITGGRALL